MNPAVKSSLLWGLVGGLSFLVLLQGYHLVSGEFVGIELMVGVAVIVGVTSAIITHVLRPVVAQWNERT